MGEDRPYAVLITDEAAVARGAILSKKDRREADAVLRLLDTVPYIGRAYDPMFEAARPPVPHSLELFVGNYGIYYMVREEERKVIVLALEDSRTDPTGRFGNLC